MRNLIEYPITQSELLMVLDLMIEREMDREMVGSINATALEIVQEIVKRYEGPAVTPYHRGPDNSRRKDVDDS